MNESKSHDQMQVEVETHLADANRMTQGESGVSLEEKSAMEVSGQHDILPLNMEDGIDGNSLPGIIAVLGELKPGTVITEEGMAHLFHRHVVSVKRAVQRGELPPPCRLFGANVWTAGALIRYIESRLDQAAQEAARDAQRMQNLSHVSRSSRRP